VLSAALALLVAVLTLPWESADEPDHVRDVQALAAGHLYRIEVGGGAEPHQPPAAYALLAAWQRLAGQPPFAVTPQRGCNFFFRRCKLVFRHDTAADGRDQRRVTLLRLPGVVLGALTVLLTALAASRLSRDAWTPVVAAATVAFVPRFVFLSGVVTNDDLAITMAAAATGLAAAALCRRPATRRDRRRLAVGLGAVIGLLVLTKLTALALLPGLLLAAWALGSDRREAVRLLALVIGIALLVSGPWLVWNAVTYGDPLAARATHAYFEHYGVIPGHGALLYIVGSTSHVLLHVMPHELYRGVWYQSGWSSFGWPGWAYLPFWLLTAGAIAGLARRRERPAGSPTGQRSRPLLALALLVAVPPVAVWLAGLGTNTASARWVLVGLPALACLVALGFERHRAPLALRFALPAIGLIGCVVAIRHDVVQPQARVAAVGRVAARLPASGSGRVRPLGQRSRSLRVDRTAVRHARGRAAGPPGVMVAGLARRAVRAPVVPAAEVVLEERVEHDEQVAAAHLLQLQLGRP
jgi:hypothetical protein